MGRLFGTDGARGIANTELGCELALQIGREFATILAETEAPGKRPRVLLGMDTRASSPMLAMAMAAGLNSAGADAALTGVVPTPAVAHLTAQGSYSAGAMISASHNPCEYNGIKLFRADGRKVADQTEERIEQMILDEPETARPAQAGLSPCLSGAPTGGFVGRSGDCPGALASYTAHLEATVDPHLARDLAAQGIRRIALDCANGSASVTAPRLFTALGFDCAVLSAAPDGENINLACGSTHIEALQSYVREHGTDAAFAFDGDADRLLAVDETGALVDGDKIIAICAGQWLRENRLRGRTAVVTVMSNLGLFRFCEQRGIRCEVTAVGDRYVLEAMTAGGHSIGGEQSGHIIFSDYATTGDGQLTALQLLEVMRRTGRPLSSLAAEMETFPQKMINVRVSNLGKVRCASDPEIALAVRRAEAELGGEGRVLVRVSGTEPLVRVMMEGREAARIERLAEELAEVVRERLL
ncbi:MAG: phosphoglucosamine mutase [Oscillospiraceae bacterium]|jgi:phosphoglucosamine mutase|nr:phosphoglucosamine mutase [Oscillospiraceae bacterium]